jgi:hypothetical protein
MQIIAKCHCLLKTYTIGGYFQVQKTPSDAWAFPVHSQGKGPENPLSAAAAGAFRRKTHYRWARHACVQEDRPDAEPGF